MRKNTYLCPVPLEQQPLYEYKNLKKSIIFFWTTEKMPSYMYKIIAFVFLNCLSIELLYSISNSMETNIMKQFIISSLISIGVLILLFLRIYLGWKYIYKRLKKATVSYEESGWYDGNIWIKTPNVLIKENLIADYILYPIIRRIQITLVILVGSFILCLLYI